MIDTKEKQAKAEAEAQQAQNAYNDAQKTTQQESEA